MASKAKKDTSAKPAGDQKFNSASKKRKMSDLKKSESGSIIVVIRAAASLANQNERKNLGLEKNSSKNLAGRLNSVVKPGGKIDLMDDSSETYKKLKSLAKSAVTSLKSSSYDASVTDLLKFCLTELNSSSGGGKRGYNPGMLEGISL